MKTYKVVFDGYIKDSDLDKMISNEYGKSAMLIGTSKNSRGTTEATVEFDDDVPYEVIELMTDGNIIVQQLVLEDFFREERKLKESRESEFFSMTESFTNFIVKSDEGEFLAATILSYMTARNITFDEARDSITRNMDNFLETAFNLYIGK